MIGTLLRTIFFYTVMLLVALIFAVPALIIACLPARWRYDSKLYGRLLQLGSWILLRATLLPVKITGWENIPNESVIFAANHQSFLDIPLLGAMARGAPQIWFFKEELARIPVFGFFIRRMGVIVDRRTLGKATQALSSGLRLSNGMKRHIVIFPEGARFTDGKVHAFLSGFAIIAKHTKRPVVPVMLYNTGKIAAPRAFFINNYPFRVVIGQPFRIGDEEPERAFVQRVHQWFVAQQEQ